MGRGFGKGKYKKIIKSIYPLTPDGDIQVHNIGKLVHFCQISPTKLIKVAGYVERKTNSDLTKSKLRFVGASMKIFQDLIKGCRKNLNLFSNNVLRLIKLLLECSFPKLKIIAAETFIQFTEVLDENTPYPELEALIAYLIDMCQNTIRDSDVRTRLKQDGLKSIRSYIRVLEMTDELDGFIARYTDNDNWAVLLPAILDNLTGPAANAPGGIVVGEADPAPSSSPSTFPHSAVNTMPNPLTHPPSPAIGLENTAIPSQGREDESTDIVANTQHLIIDIEGDSVHTLATEVLRDLFSRANISVTSMFKAILRYLDFKHRWIPNAFAVYVIQSIYDCLKIQHEQILITLLLQHVEQAGHSVVTKGQIFWTTTQFFTESTGYFMQILDSLVKHMVSSVEFLSQDQQVVDSENAHLGFQDDMIACLDMLCTKISQQQKFDAFSALCTRLNQSKHVSSSGLSGVVVIFLRAILQVIVCTHQFPIDLLVPHLQLFQELSLHSSNDVRVYVQKIFQSILVPVFGPKQQKVTTMVTPNSATKDSMPEQVAVVIRGTLYFQIKMRMKHAESYVAIYDTLRAMLYRGGKYDLIESFPLVFSIQKFATKWKKIPPIRAYTIHTLVAAYLYCVASIFHCKALKDYIDTIMQERISKNQTCSLVVLQKEPIPTLLLLSTAEYSQTLQKKVAVDYVLFDRQTIVDMLCITEGSTIANEKFHKILMKKFRNLSDTITLKTGSSCMLRNESTYFSPPSPVAPVLSSTNENITGTAFLPPSDSKLIVFSPEHSINSQRDESEVHYNSKIDIMSMKRALVVGIPKAVECQYSNSQSYINIFTNCQQKETNIKQLLLLTTSYLNKI